MAATEPSPLKLFAAPEARRPSTESRSEVCGGERIGRLCAAFGDATGWPLRYAPTPAPPTQTDQCAEATVPGRDAILAWSAPVIPGVGVSPGHLKIDLDGDVVLTGDGHAAAAGHCDWSSARRLAEELAELLTDIACAGSVLRDYQAELAAAIPHYVRPVGETELARRIDAVVRGGAEGLGCQAAAMYLLDEATTSLLLRAAWGLPSTSLADGTRDLEYATADLEALIGHAVVLEDDALFELWNVPERQFAAAVCVPVSSSTTLLGTFWLYSSTPRDFTDGETNLIEILAGRLAVEIEREMLLRQQRPRPT